MNEYEFLKKTLIFEMVLQPNSNTWLLFIPVDSHLPLPGGKYQITFGLSKNLSKTA